SDLRSLWSRQESEKPRRVAEASDDCSPTEYWASEVVELSPAALAHLQRNLNGG
ncbi:MAG: hypothetical protein K0S88_5734, partial [Actinomycetia bacterium]|nr:hypothetical protein [Actinomycetes bacterium]